jgi:hypothetical protein
MQPNRAVDRRPDRGASGPGLGAMIAAGIGALLAGCGNYPPGAPYALAPVLPYAACGEMVSLRNQLTGAPNPSPQSDAELHAIGVRCIGSGYPAVRARY